MVVPSGIEMAVSLGQSEKLPSPKVVSVVGNSMFSKDLHTLYLQPIITQYFIDNKSEIWLLFLIAHSKR